MSCIGRFRLHPAVFYRRYGDSVIVYHTGQQTVLTLNDSAGDILELFQNYISLDEAIHALEQKYDINNEEDFYKDTDSFIRNLIDRQIIKKEYTQEEVFDDLEKEISRTCIDDDQLFTVTIETTYKCNERCRHCYIADEHKSEMSFETIKRVLDELAEMNVFNLVFTGGEFFLRDDAFQILEYTYSKHFLFEIFTNGTLIDGNDFIRLKRVWPKCIHFSLYSHKHEKHDAISRVEGSFFKTLNSIRSCIDMGIPVNIKTPVFAETMDDIEGIVLLANSLGASIEISGNITPKKDGDLTPLKMKVHDEESARVKDTIDRLIAKNGTNQKKHTNKLCGAGDRSISISPYGKVYPCNLLPLCIGDVLTDSLDNIWKNSEMLRWWRSNKIREKKQGCGDCKYLEQCVFCPGEAMLRTGNPLQKYDAACQKTKLAIAR